MGKNRKHPDEMNLQAWIPEDLYLTFLAKIKRKRMTVRGVVIRLLEAYTGYQKPEGLNDGTPPDQTVGQ